MSKLAEIAFKLKLAVYKHDFNILKNHEKEVQDKFEQLDGRNNDTEKVRKFYHDKIKEVINKQEVYPQDVQNILHIFDKKLGE